VRLFVSEESATVDTRFAAAENFVGREYFVATKRGILVLRATPDETGIVFADANPAACRILGYRDRGAFTKLASAADVFDPQYQGEALNYWKKLLSRQAESVCSVITAVCADGLKIALESESIVVDGNDGPAVLFAFEEVDHNPGAEDALKQSEDRLQALIMHPTLGMMVRSGEDILYCNPAYAAIFGYDNPDEVMAVTPATNLAAESERARLDGYRRARTAGESVPDSYEFQAIRKDGSLIWLENRVVATVWDEQPAYVTIAIDITERRRMAEALEKSERHFRALAEKSFEGMTVIRNGQVVFVNFAAARYLGYGHPDEIVALGDIDRIIYPADRELTKRNRARRLKGGEALTSYEFRLLHKDGSPKWIENRATVIDWDGDEAVFSIFADIEKRKRAEAELRKSRESLSNAQRIAGLGNWDWDIARDEHRWSDQNYRVLGLEPKSVQPGRQSFMARVHPDDRDFVSRSVNAALNDEDEYAIDYRIVLTDGAIRHVRGEAEISRDGTGNAVEMAGTIQDITQRKEMEDALQAAKEEAESANRVKSEFLSSMSHELRNPLNAVLGFGQLLANDSANPLTKSQSIAVEQILMGGEHLLSLIGDVLDLARIESGNLTTVIENIDIGQVIEEVFQLAGSSARKRMITLRNGCQIEANGARLVLADKTRLRQVILNLVSNGIKYNSERGQVVVSGESVGDGRFRVKVSDTGPGISKELTPRLFEPFDRLGAEASSVEGTGIGLTISKQLIELMDGEIGFDTEVGKGSVFWIEIPLALEDVEPRAAKVSKLEHQELLAIVPVTGRRFRVLYIEDNSLNVALMHGIFEQVPSVSMISAQSAEQGLEMARVAPPDLVLLDLNLPGMNGFLALDNLRSETVTRDIPVIAVTADATALSEERCRLAGFQGFLTKPIDVDEIFKIVTQYATRGDRDCAPFTEQ
jgi:PAS domain S-box-containing protein